MAEYTETWSKVEGILKNAYAELAPGEREAIQYHEFLDHNELGLAWGELAELGKSEGGPSFWLLMSQAANLMQLSEPETRHLLRAMEGFGNRTTV